jgi:hypothetical protein
LFLGVPSVLLGGPSSVGDIGQGVDPANLEQRIIEP